MFSVHAMVAGGQSTAARSAQVEVILELSRDVFFRSRMFFPPHPTPKPPPLTPIGRCRVYGIYICRSQEGLLREDRGLFAQ